MLSVIFKTFVLDEEKLMRDNRCTLKCRSVFRVLKRPIYFMMNDINIAKSILHSINLCDIFAEHVLTS